MTNKKYNVIIADPPWDYDVSGGRGVAENHYPTMKINDICKIDIPSIASDSCILLLWGTWPKIPDALYLMQNWGFEYVTGFPWIKITTIDRSLFDGQVYIKPQWGTGFWFRGASEYVLMGRRGNPKTPINVPIGLLGKRVIHSKKLGNLHDYAQQFPPPYLELFAREPREGWDSFGNEIDNSITIGEKL